jgi:DNA-binding response OmpR family regulator
MAEETILVVDDEANIRELARMYLEQDGYRVVTASDGRRALDTIQQQSPALMVLDLMLPEVDGWEVCRQVRAKSSLPILMLTARTDDIDKIVGLELGADDYLTKPFNPRELVARVRAILRRVNTAELPPENQTKHLSNVTIDSAGREVIIGSDRINLRAKEFDLLWTLAANANMVLSREQLLNKVWGYDYYGETRTVDVHIAHLREKLSAGDIQIETVWGKGYKLVV